MIDQQLYERLTGDATLMSMVEKVYNTVAYEEAPASVPYPHLVFWWLGGTDEYTLTTRIRVVGRYEIRITGEITSLAAMQTALVRVETLLKDHAFAGTLYCRRQMRMPHTTTMESGLLRGQVRAIYQVEVR